MAAGRTDASTAVISSSPGELAGLVVGIAWRCFVEGQRDDNVTGAGAGRCYREELLNSAGDN